MIKMKYYKKAVFLLTLIFCYGIALPQEYEDLIVAGPNDTKTELQNIVNHLLKKDTTSFSMKKMNWYHHLLSSSYVWLDEMDKAKYHWFRALELDPEDMCFFTRMNVKRDIPESHFLESVPISSYFAYQFSSDTKSKFFAICESCCNGGRKTKQIDTLTYNSIDSIFLELQKNDQKYRGPNSISIEQNKLDSINRNSLDSIYSRIGFPNKHKVNSNSLNTVWLIIHHSTDCEWTGTWLSRALYEIENGNLKLGFYPETMDRFYNKKDGYCLGKEHHLMSNKYIRSVMTDEVIKVDNKR